MISTKGGVPVAPTKESEEFEQMSLIIADEEDFQPVTPFSSLVTPNTAREIVAELHSRQPVPDEVAKSRSLIMDDMVENEFETTLEINQEEKSPLANSNIRIKALVSKNLDNKDIKLKTSETLTRFDREVIDAVATLIGHIDVMSSATIYRTISGKQSSQYVTPAQLERVEESLRRCSRCTVEIDATAAFLKAIPQQKGKTKKLSFRGPLIAYSEVIHETDMETNTYYQILQIPPIFKYAETIGKVSRFPFELLDTPVKKTESLIFVQAYLLRTIDEMNQGLILSPEISWEKLYEIADCDVTKRQYTEKLRKNTIKMLDYWVYKGFIAGYTSILKGKNKKIVIERMDAD